MARTITFTFLVRSKSLTPPSRSGCKQKTSTLPIFYSLDIPRISSRPFNTSMVRVVSTRKATIFWYPVRRIRALIFLATPLSSAHPPPSTFPTTTLFYIKFILGGGKTTGCPEWLRALWIVWRCSVWPQR